ncbi:MAG: sigma 54-interacting transcriptional regulator, partial [bacterium]
GEIRPVGSTQTRKVDVRIIAAASANLRAEVAAGKFRQDLFFRLHVVNVPLPPLRERKDDIALLASHFLNGIAAKHKKKISGFRSETMVLLESYAWPGNVRELEHVIERMVILAEQDSAYLGPGLLLPEIQTQLSAVQESPTSKPSPLDMKAQHDAHERVLLLEALSKYRWNQSAAAKALGMRESNLRYKMRKHGIKKP